MPHFKPELVFLDWLGQWAPKTQRFYAGVLRDLCSFLRTKSKVPDVSERDAVQFLAHLRSRNLCAWTIRQKFFVLNSIYRAMLRNRVVLVNPFDTLLDSIPKGKPGMVKPHRCIPFDAVQALLAKGSGLGGPDNLRDRFILVLLFGCALRANEILSLNCGDVRCDDDGTYFLLLRKTKAQCEQESIIPTFGVGALIAYKQSMLAMGAWGKDHPLIPTFRLDGSVARRMSYSSLSAIFKKLLLTVGLKGYGLHDARATVITKMLTDGCSYWETQQVSRHASVQMVEVYDKRIAEKKNHPAHKISF